MRRSSGGLSSAMRNPNPTVTADTPSGSDTSASSARPCRRRERDGAAAADDDREHGREHRVTQRRADRVDGRHEQGAARDGARRARGRSRARIRLECAAIARRGRRSDRRAGLPSPRGSRRRRGARAPSSGGARFRRRRATGARAPLATLDARGDGEQHARRPRAARASAPRRAGGSGAARSGGRSRSRASRTGGRRG